MVLIFLLFHYYLLLLNFLYLLLCILLLHYDHLYQLLHFDFQQLSMYKPLQNLLLNILLILSLNLNLLHLVNYSNKHHHFLLLLLLRYLVFLLNISFDNLYRYCDLQKHCNQLVFHGNFLLLQLFLLYIHHKN